MLFCASQTKRDQESCAGKIHEDLGEIRGIFRGKRFELEIILGFSIER